MARREAAVGQLDAQVRLEDMQVRRKDARLRREDTLLHEENAQLRLALERLTNRTLHGSRAPTGHSPASGSGPHLSKRIIAIIACSVVAALAAVVAFQWYRYRSRKRKDEADVAKHFKRTQERKAFLGVGWSTVRQIAILIIVATVGFAILWHYGILQTYMSQMICMAYVLGVMVSMLLIFAHEAWSDLERSHHDIMDKIKSVERIFDGGMADVPGGSAASWLPFGGRRGASAEPPRRSRSRATGR